MLACREVPAGGRDRKIPWIYTPELPSESLPHDYYVAGCVGSGRCAGYSRLIRVGICPARDCFG